LEHFISDAELEFIGYLRPDIPNIGGCSARNVT